MILIIFAGSCPFGTNYVYVDGKCYFVDTTGRTLSNAISNCQAAFGDGALGKLFEPLDEDNHDIVVDAAHSVSKQEYWLGFSDKLSEGHFHYDNGPPLTFSKWGIG